MYLNQEKPFEKVLRKCKRYVTHTAQLSWYWLGEGTLSWSVTFYRGTHQQTAPLTTRDWGYPPGKDLGPETRILPLKGPGTRHWGIPSSCVWKIKILYPSEYGKNDGNVGSTSAWIQLLEDCVNLRPFSVCVGCSSKSIFLSQKHCQLALLYQIIMSWKSKIKKRWRLQMHDFTINLQSRFEGQETHHFIDWMLWQNNCSKWLLFVKKMFFMWWLLFYQQVQRMQVSFVQLPLKFWQWKMGHATDLILCSKQKDFLMFWLIV